MGFVLFVQLYVFPRAAFVIVLWYKSPVPWVSRVYGFVLFVQLYVFPRAAPSGIHITALRVQIPYTLETHGTTITCLYDTYTRLIVKPKSRRFSNPLGMEFKSNMASSVLTIECLLCTVNAWYQRAVDSLIMYRDGTVIIIIIMSLPV